MGEIVDDLEVRTTEAPALLDLGGVAEFRALVRAEKVAPVAVDCWRIADLVRARLRAVIDAATYHTTAKLAHAFGISTERVRQLTVEGVLKPAGKNRYHRDDTTRAYAAWQREQTTSVHRNTSESRVREARATEIEIRTAERTRELIAIDEALEANALVVGFVRTEFGGLAARVTRDLNLRRDIEKAVNESLARIADRCNAEADNLAAGRNTIDAVADDDAGRMGESEPKLSADVGGAGRA